MKIVPLSSGFMSYLELKKMIEALEFDEHTEEFITTIGLGNLYDTVMDALVLCQKEYGFDGAFFVYEDLPYPVALFGALPIIYGNVEIFSVVSTQSTPYKFTKIMRGFLNMLTSKSQIKRIQSLVVADNEKACKLHEHFGFEREGLLRKYDGSNDYYMYALVKK